MKKQLLMEELKRQGKAPKKGLWIFLGLTLLSTIAAGGFWYYTNLQTRLEETFQKGLALRQAGQYVEAVELFE
ncbi:MAG: hypothetical protein OEL80_07570, partial [Desulfuromonadales bacterium]|nr:hypothetical protein [Desulfuromonadales bacterium]